MSITVFVGPTLRQADVEMAIPRAICLPPVAQGDVYRVARLRPDAIGIIDGYFSGAPSVWHKEILWALSEGIPVFGSASMGALRAAELHPYGMRGVGRIFEAFRDGDLEEDDEVAVVHGPAELGYPLLSEPMVNIRATLARAETAGIVSAEARRALEAMAKAAFFPQRAWPVMLTSAAKDIEPVELARLQAWLPNNIVDRKREDALEMLAAMNEHLAEPRTSQALPRFEWTHLWNNLTERIGNEDLPGTAGDVKAVRLLDELRLLGPVEYDRVRSHALLRLLGEAQARRQGIAITANELRAASARLRAELGLYSHDELIAWAKRNDLDERSFARLLLDDAQLRSVGEAADPLLPPLMLDELRLSGAYESLADRARNKARRLDGLNVGGRRAGNAPGPETLQIRLWYFAQRLGQTLPEDLDRYARVLGFAGVAEFDRAVRREWLYCRLVGGDGSQASCGS